MLNDWINLDSQKNYIMANYLHKLNLKFYGINLLEYFNVT